MSSKTIKKILIVDDVKMIRMVLEKELSGRGFEVVSVGYGSDAIKMCNSSDKPDLVLLDLKLPDIPGLQVLRQIKVDSPDISVIVVSAMGENETINKALSSGADEFIVKPINFDYLFEIIGKIEQGIGIGQDTNLKKAAIISANGNIRSALKKILTEKKFETILIANEDEFNEKFKFRKFDVILLDYDFNNSNSMYYVNLLVKKKVDMNRVIMIVPNSLSQEDLIEIRKNNIKNVILKPIAADNVISKIESVCELN